MTEDKTKSIAKRPESWLSYRSRGSDTLHRVKVPTVLANRWAKKLTYRKPYVWDIVEDATGLKTLKRTRMFSSVDFLLIEPVYEEAVKKQATKEAKVHLQVSQSKNWRAKKHQEIQEQEEQEIIANRVTKTGRLSTTRMSFHVGRLEQAVILLCPITGIIGKLEMPYCPVALNYEHPLAKPGNVLNLLRYHFSLPGQQADIQYLKAHSKLKLDRQTLAGCLLSLLKGKNLLAEEQETNATERNMVLQNAGYEVIADLLKEMVRLWDNLQVWKKMPRFSVEWKAHSSTDSTIGYALQNYLKILKSVLDPISELSKEEQAKLFSSMRPRDTKARGIKVYSASAVEHRKIKNTKTEAYDAFEVLKPHLNIAHRTLITRTIRDLLILPPAEKNKAASLLRVAFIGKPQAAVARQLADAIEGSSNESILSEMGETVASKEMQEHYQRKSIKDILEAKKRSKEQGEQE